MQRQIKACTHCRQHKVRCDAAKCYPNACTRCSKFSLNCIVDQNFKPRKGGQVELLREHLSRIQEQIQNITTTGIKTGNGGSFGQQNVPGIASASRAAADVASFAESLGRPGSDSQQYQNQVKRESVKPEFPGNQFNGEFPHEVKANGNIKPQDTPNLADDDGGVKEIEASVAERMAAGGHLVPIPGPYILEHIQLEEKFANSLHDYFMTNCAPYMPMFESDSAGELYARSEFLFWAVMITAALAEPTSHLYVSMVDPVKRLASTKCLLETTRSSSVVQALLVLSTWPLPSVKMLEDMSPRFASLAYSMGLQLGMHRGKFIYEFSRNQLLMPNAVKWRTRTWVQTYITQQMVSASSGIPAAMPVDHMIDHALHDKEHPLSPRTDAMLKLARFYSKTVSIMASSVDTEDGLMEPNTRYPTLDLLRTDLRALFPTTESFEDPVIEISYLYAHCILDAFAFLPDTPHEHQSGFIIDAFQSCTRIVTLTRKLVDNRKIIEFPSFIRNPCCFAALMLFRLHLLPQLPQQYVNSARESIVTCHHLFRNMPPSWLGGKVDNDVSRIAKLMEGLNHVIITHPELLQSRRVMRRMRSHLTFSMFYELIFIVHEARRRNVKRINTPDPRQAPRHCSDGNLIPQVNEALKRSSSEMDKDSPDSWNSDEHSPGPMHKVIHAEEEKRKRDLNPLPLFNDINMESYFASTAVSPNGTTSTKLFPATQDGVQEPANGSNGYAEVADQNEKRVSEVPSNGDVLPEPLINEHQAAAGMMTDGISAGSTNVDMHHLLDGIGWMDTEGDDFLGWMMPRNE